MGKPQPTDLYVTIYTRTEHGGIWSSDQVSKALYEILPKKAEILDIPKGYSSVCRQTGEVAVHDIAVRFPSKKSVRDWHKSMGWNRNLNGFTRHGFEGRCSVVTLPNYSILG